MLNCVRDLVSENPGLMFRISLRSDVYYLVRTSDESTDKIEGSVVWCQWSNHEIFVLLIKRILSFFNETVDENQLLKTEQHHLSYYLDGVFEHKFEGRGKWRDIATYKVLMSMIRKRPRDLVKLCSLAAREANISNANIISSVHLQKIFEEYSQGRLQDTINEYKSEMPQIEDLLLGMKPTNRRRSIGSGYIYTTQELNKKLNNILGQKHLSFKSGKPCTAKELTHFLYKINFLTARKDEDDGTIVRRYFEDNRYLSSSSADFGFDWEVHPAFRWALQPDKINDIFDDL